MIQMQYSYFSTFIKNIFLGFLILMGHTLLADASETDSKNPNAQKPVVIVSIKPIYGLIKALLQEDADIHLLQKGGQSGHTLSLSARDIKRLTTAHAVIWVGPSYEMVLGKALEAAIKPNQLIACQDAPDLLLLSKRTGNLFPPCSCGQHHTPHAELETKDPHPHHQIDGHFWLDVMNIKICTAYIAHRLMDLFPDLADRIFIRKQQLLVDLDKLHDAMKIILEPVRGKTALTDHDSLYYLEKEYGFTIRGVLSNDEGLSPSLRHIEAITAELDANINENLIQVFFFEKNHLQGTTSLVEKLTKPYHLPLYALDYDGSYITCAPKDEHQYYQIILLSLANQIKEGFSQHPMTESPAPLVDLKTPVPQEKSSSSSKVPPKDLAETDESVTPILVA